MENNRVVVDGSRNESPIFLNYPISNRLDLKWIQLEVDTQVLVCYYINYRIRKAGFMWPDCPRLPTFPKYLCFFAREFCDKFEEEEKNRLETITRAFQRVPISTEAEFLVLCKHLFRDNGRNEMKISWVRIMALLVFSGNMAVEYMERGMLQHVTLLVQWLIKFFQDHVLKWLDSHNDNWENFIWRYGLRKRFLSIVLALLPFGITMGIMGLALSKF
jgi:hypothetical protein